MGHSDNLEDRLNAHRLGSVDGYTKARRPVHLVYSREFPTRDEAFAAERQIKGWSRKKKEALMKEDWEEVRSLARGRGRGGGHPSTGSG